MVDGVVGWLGVAVMVVLVIVVGGDGVGNDGGVVGG